MIIYSGFHFLEFLLINNLHWFFFSDEIISHLFFFQYKCNNIGFLGIHNNGNQILVMKKKI